VEESLTWTSPGELDGFLYLDRNGNGVVDNGSELFGNFTALTSGEVAGNGYEALAEFDLTENGGNDNSSIESTDAIFSSLRVWIDIDGDGQFESYESMGLSEAGVVAISLEGILTLPSTDVHGNWLFYRSRIWVEGQQGQVLPGWSVDVFFRGL
jgi:hypothetical protein